VLESAEDQAGDREEEDGGNDALGPEAVDAPLLKDVGFDVAEEGGEEEGYLSDFEEKPPAAHEGEDSDYGVAEDSEHCDGDVVAGLRVFVKGAGREDGEAAVVDGSAVKLFSDCAWRDLGRVHVMDAERHDGDCDSRHGEKGDQVFHVFHFTSRGSFALLGMTTEGAEAMARRAYHWDAGVCSLRVVEGVCYGWESPEYERLSDGD
jgi:hypothetical protein